MRSNLVERYLLREDLRGGNLAPLLENRIFGSHVISAETELAQAPSSNLPLNPRTRYCPDRDDDDQRPYKPQEDVLSVDNVGMPQAHAVEFMAIGIEPSDIECQPDK